MTTEIIKELRFDLPVLFRGTCLDVVCTAQMIEPGEIADITVLEYFPGEGQGALEDTLGADSPDEVAQIETAIYEQHGDCLVECLNELFK